MNEPSPGAGPGDVPADAPDRATLAPRGETAAEPGLAPPPADAQTPPTPPAPGGVRELVLETLAEGPLTGFEIARRIIVLEPGALGAREGHLYPLLLEMRREGAVEARWVTRGGERCRVYGLPGTIPEDADDDASAAAAPLAPRTAPSPAIERMVASATAALAFAPLLAEEARAELTAHARELSAARSRAGLAPAAADREAIRALGDPWKISTDLARAARGRPTVIFPRTAGEALRSLAIYDAGIILAIVATVLFVRVQVVAAYHIPTKSMEPTLHGDREGGDKILVFQLAAPPRRFDIEVFEGWGADRRQYVKRCVGLPGEDVRLHDGDLWIDGRLIRKDGETLDAMLFPLFDAETERDAARARREESWKPLKDAWSAPRWAIQPGGVFESPEGATDAAPAVLAWKARLDDGLYDDDSGRLEAGMEPVGDGRITLDVAPLDDSCRLLVRWERDGETFDAVLRGEQPGVAIFVNGAEVARDPAATLPAGRATRVRFSAVDRVLRLEAGDGAPLRFDLPERRAVPDSPQGAEVSVRVPAGRARITPVRLERDVHWTSEYERLGRPTLGDDEFFFLGDNSSNSDDCRKKGAVHRSRLVGKPVLIVWPPSRFRVPR